MHKRAILAAAYTIVVVVSLYCAIRGALFYILCKNQEMGQFVALGDFGLDMESAVFVMQACFAVSAFLFVLAVFLCCLELRKRGKSKVDKA